MLVEEVAEAIRTCARSALDDVQRALWAAHASGQVTDDEAESLSVVIEARRGPSRAARAIAMAGLSDCGDEPTVPPLLVGRAKSPRRPPCPVRAEALERSRRWAAAGRLPPAIACKFTSGEQAALAVIAFEVTKRQTCSMAIGAIAALAGVSESTVKRAVKQARALGLLTKEERRLSRYRNDTNILRIISKTWLSWIDLRGKGGGQRRTGTNTNGLRDRESGQSLEVREGRRSIGGKRIVQRSDRKCISGVANYG